MRAFNEVSMMLTSALKALITTFCVHQVTRFSLFLLLEFLLQFLFELRKTLNYYAFICFISCIYRQDKVHKINAIFRQVK